jgi:isoleucyl-tRNA synthetase
MIYREYKGLDLPSIDREILDFWKQKKIFQQSISSRSEDNAFVFYEGPPSANGMPGIHHVVGRTIKDIFCRYKTLQGFRVERKGGWDTHGLPIELKVEKDLGITKDDIGVKISIDDYNKKCRETVFLYKEKWDAVTTQMGYWLDLDDPYITFENEYIESVWHIINQVYEKDLMYKGLTIQPYSPAAGTGLSSHEVNMPGSYQDVTDTSAVACFEVKSESMTKLNNAFQSQIENALILAWTTTPWTLPSNTALCVGPKIRYALIQTFNPYTKEPQAVILAKDLLGKWMKPENEKSTPNELVYDEKNIPFIVLGECQGSDLAGIEYHQLLSFEANAREYIEGQAFKVISGAFVTTTDGTGIVHIAPSFGADDRKVAQENGIGELTMVDSEGKFIDGMGYLSGRFVKDYRNEEGYKNPDVDIAIDLKTKGQAFNVQKYVHSYPHCWRTGKPILYYPLDSWFISTTKIKDKLIANNKKINWKPESTGSGRFGQWLENIQDWNLTRSRFWGIPLPIWVNSSKDVIICVSGKQDLFDKIKLANDSGLLSSEELSENLKFIDKFDQGKGDFHKPFIDFVTLVDNGQILKREEDVIDVWFDSGSMPYAQWNYPFTNQEKFKKNYPADFIAEGVDQTRGWFYTLHVISTILFDQPAYKNVISNGLVLDVKGEKMSKSKGNVVDPFNCMDTYGADAVRWYIISNSSPWDNLKFDMKGIEEVKRKLFGTIYNTYSFFTLYANIDEFRFNEQDVTPALDRPEIDQWIISKLNTLKREVTDSLENYEPTVAARLIENFVDRNLSNWYVRLNRRRFWKQGDGEDKKAAYETLYECLLTVSQLMSPFAPFFGEWMYRNLTETVREDAVKNNTPLRLESVHLTTWAPIETRFINQHLEERIELAQDVSSMILSLRKKEQIKVRQPLQKVIIPILNDEQREKYGSIESIVKSETNIKEFEYVEENSGLFVKSAKANFKTLGKKLGKDMSTVASQIAAMDSAQISGFQRQKFQEFTANGNVYRLGEEDIEIATSDMPGFLVVSEYGQTIALDITLTEQLLHEGIAREFVNKIQNYRKDNGFNVTDKIAISYGVDTIFEKVLLDYKSYIMNEVLATEIQSRPLQSNMVEMEINEIRLKLEINKI